MINGKRLRVVFAGTPEFAVPTLQALATSPHEVIAVYSQPDRRSGRGRQLRMSAVKQSANALDIPVYQPASFREQSVIDTLKALDADIMVVVAYGQILPLEALEAPRLGCVNVHGSLLPRWRGAAPLQRAIVAGDAQTGVTIMQMEEGLDTGPMLAAESVEINVNTTAAQLHDQLAELGATLLLPVLSALCDKSAVAVVQDESLATYAPKLSKSEAIIDWSCAAIDIHRQICAFNPGPVAETTLDGARLRIWQSTVSGLSYSGLPGTVVRCNKTGFEVVTGSGTLSIEQLQLPGKTPMGYRDYVNGRDVTGTVLGLPAKPPLSD